MNIDDLLTQLHLDGDYNMLIIFYAYKYNFVYNPKVRKKQIFQFVDSVIEDFFQKTFS